MQFTAYLSFLFSLMITVNPSIAQSIYTAAWGLCITGEDRRKNMSTLTLEVTCAGSLADSGSI